VLWTYGFSHVPVWLHFCFQFDENEMKRAILAVDIKAKTVRRFITSVGLQLDWENETKTRMKKKYMRSKES